MHVRIALALLLLCACASHEDGSRPTSPAKTADAEPQPKRQPQPEPEAEPQPQPQPRSAKASIASVQMNQDCPDPAPPASPAAAPPAPAKPVANRAARGASLTGKGPRQPCTQSTMQLAFAVEGDAPARVVIDHVRMVDASNAEDLATIESRRPMAWAEGSYRAWDEAVPGGGEIKASYSLRVPDWADVEAKIGGPSFGHMFVLEVELTIDGEPRTLRSPAFTRERPHVIVT